MWNKIEGHKTYKVGEKGRLKVDKNRPLNPGDNVVIFERRSGLLKRRVESRISVQIDDNNNATVVSERPQEPIIVADGFEVFPSSFETKTIIDTSPITRQDIVVNRGKKVVGVLWTNENGEKPKVTSVRKGRTFYVDDTDPEAIETEKMFAHLNKMVSEGRVTGGGGGGAGR